jgi:hypothetical protein
MAKAGLKPDAELWVQDRTGRFQELKQYLEENWRGIGTKEFPLPWTDDTIAIYWVRYRKMQSERKEELRTHLFNGHLFS